MLYIKEFINKLVLLFVFHFVCSDSVTPYANTQTTTFAGQSSTTTNAGVAFNSGGFSAGGGVSVTNNQPPVFSGNAGYQNGGFSANVGVTGGNGYPTSTSANVQYKVEF